jgi:hypothetical protein
LFAPKEKVMRNYRYVLGVVVLSLLAGNARAADPLPSWEEGDTKNSIVEFVAAVTDISGPDYVPPAGRIAVFDNDGTLWSEKLAYFQLLFAIDRVKALAPQYPQCEDRTAV